VIIIKEDFSFSPHHEEYVCKRDKKKKKRVLDWWPKNAVVEEKGEKGSKRHAILFPAPIDEKRQ